MGPLVGTRGDEVGYGGEDSYLVPILGERMPDKQLSPPEPPPLQHSESAPVEPHAPASVSEIELPHAIEAMPPPLALARKVTESDMDGAVDVLRRAGVDVPATALSAKAWVDLSKACLA